MANTAGESPRSARKRTSSRTSRSSRESGSSQKRATDIFQTVKSRYQNVHSRDMPSCRRQTLHRATDRPLSLKYDPATIPKTKQKGDMDRVTDVLLTMQGGNMGNVGVGRSKLVGADRFRSTRLWGIRGAMGRGRLREILGRMFETVILIRGGRNLGGRSLCLSPTEWRMARQL